MNAKQLIKTKKILRVSPWKCTNKTDVLHYQDRFIRENHPVLSISLFKDEGYLDIDVFPGSGKLLRMEPIRMVEAKKLADVLFLLEIEGYLLEDLAIPWKSK